VTTRLGHIRAFGIRERAASIRLAIAWSDVEQIHVERGAILGAKGIDR
jgi:hypothetical protein